MNIEIQKIVAIAREAGDAIMAVYDRPTMNIEYKDDASPLTEADLAANDIITAGLALHYPAIPVVSEESATVPYSERKVWERFWLVDPLDGTKEFIRRNGEFTVNIALIEGGLPVAGVVYAPALDLMYYANRSEGAWRVSGKGMAERLPLEAEIGKRPLRGIRVVASRSHRTPETDDLIEQLKKEYETVELVSRGSSLKICLVAEGSADLYPRLGPTMEWDVAAGHAVAAEALGSFDVIEGLSYNKKEMRNEWFVVRGFVS